MGATMTRLIGCWAALAISFLLFGGPGLWGILWCGIWMALFYIFLRPFLQTVILPFNIFLAGILTPVTDALLILWACAWGGGHLSYWQAVITALLAILFYLPYSRSKRQRLLGQ